MKLKIIFSLGLLAFTHLAGAEEIVATPYRPTLSNPAELSAPGWLEVEMGVARSNGGENQWQNNQPYTLKYAFSRDFGVMLLGDFRVNQIDATGQETAGQGDSTLIFKHRFGASEGQAFGLEWGAKLDTAATGIGSGKTCSARSGRLHHYGQRRGGLDSGCAGFDEAGGGQCRQPDGQLGLKNQVQHALRKWPVPRPLLRLAFSSPAFSLAGR